MFHLSDDIGERRDLSIDEPETLAMVKARFDAWKTEMRDAEPRGHFRDYEASFEL